MNKPVRKPKIAIAALGGTIAMTRSEAGGITAQNGAEELLAMLPELAELADFRAATLAKIGSASISFSLLFETLVWANQAADTGADGIIISQGTDTIEQTAFFLDLYWQRTIPLIVIGAMRGPAAAGFDGLANLLAAVHTALEPQSTGRGVLVVLNDTIHEARHVAKSHTQSLETFTSGDYGPCGRLLENRPVFYRPTASKPHYTIPKACSKKVLLLEHSLDDDSAALIRYAQETGYAGIVINGVGSGHVSANLREALVQAAKTLPCIVASRCANGSTTFDTYGYPGAEIDLQNEGVLMAGFLSAVKARLLLLAGLWNGLGKTAIAADLHAWGS